MKFKNLNFFLVSLPPTQKLRRNFPIMNKRGKLATTSKASPSKTTQSSLSKYFLGAKKDDDTKKDETKKPSPKKPSPKKVDTLDKKRGRQSDDDEEEVVAPKTGRRRLKKNRVDDDDDDEDFTPAPTAKASDNDEEMSAGEDESPKKKTTKKSSNGKSKNDTEDALSSQSSSSPSSSQSQDISSSSTTATTADGDVIVTQFKENPKLRKEFQKKLNKILDAKDNMNAVPDPTALTAAPEKKGKKSNLTPLEQQYVAIKKEYPDTALLVECGYKYKFFGEDAIVANKILKMVCYPKNNFLNASIPTQRLNVHVRRLLHAGYKVGIVKQTITAAAKKASDKVSGPFSRALSALYTPATYIDEDIGNQDEDEQATTNYLMCLTEESIGTPSSEKFRISLVAVSLGTGDIIYDSFEDDFMRSALETRLLHLQPKEFILPPTISSLSSSSSSSHPPGLLSDDTDRVLRNHASNHGIRVETLDEDKFGYETATFTVTEFYEKQKSSDDDEDDTPLAYVLKLPRDVITCVGVMIDYLKDFQKLNQVFCLTGNFRSFSTANHMLLNGTTLANLEVLVNNNNFEEKGSLFWVLKHTSTPFGKRLLKKWVTQPLVDISKIKERQEAVKEIAEGSTNASVVALCSLFKQLPDLERILCRIHYKRCSPAEFATALRNFDKVASALPALKNLQSPLLKNLISSFPPIGKSAEYFLDSISPQAASDGNLQELFIDATQFPDIAEGKKRIQKVQDQLNEHLKEIRKIVNKPNLQYSHMPKMSLEYYIELTNAQAKSVPAKWKKISHTKELSRYHTDFIIDKLQQLALQRENLTVVCQQSWTAFLDEFAGKYVEFRDAVSRLAVMDCICSLATIAKNPSYTRPVFTEKQQLIIENGRHPVVETVLADNYVPNSTTMSSDSEKCMIITGPNMGGKSSYIRQIALIIIMAQIGSYVPATSVTLSPFDAVYTRMGAQDNIEKGQSTFFVELQEASAILKQATPRSLVILDELGRGTSTHDGVAIAYATLQYLVQTLNCFSLFVTHYPLLAELEHAYPKAVANYHMSFLEEKDDEDENAPPHVTFLFKVTRGAAMNSYGLNVARIAGIPNSASQQSTQLKTTITERAFRSKEHYPLVLASKIAQLVAKHEEEDKKNNINDDDEDSQSHPSLESLLTLQQAARKALSL